MRLDKKVLLINIIICIILEAALFLALGGKAGLFTTAVGILAIPICIILVNLMLISLENSILIFTFLVPMIPITGYLMNRAKMLDYQWIVYSIFYIGTFLIMLKHKVFKNINRDKLVIKNKIIKSILIILLIINIIFAYNKQLSFMIITLSFLPFIIFFYIIGTINLRDRQRFYEKILISFVLGCIISSAPDILQFILTWIQGNKNIRLFGPLGSNFILSYFLLAYVLVLNKWVKENGWKNIWTIIVLTMSFIISMQMSRGALLSFVAIFIAYIIFNIKNWKKYVAVFLVFGGILSYNVASRSDVANDESIKELQEMIVADNIDRKNLEDVQIGGVLAKIIKSQSKTRQILWETGILVTNDYKYTGVGAGNFKYFFNEYSGTNKGYSDSHNILINMSSELGLPFMIVSLILLLIITIESLIKFFRERNKKIKLNYLSLLIIMGVILLYGNLTGMNFYNINQIYSFTPTFMILFVLFYRDNINEFM